MAETSDGSGLLSNWAAVNRSQLADFYGIPYYRRCQLRQRIQDLPPIVADLAKNIRRLMEARGISGNKLAALVGRPVMTINDLVNGRTIPGADLIFSVADALGVSTDELRGKKTSRKSA